MNFALKLSEKSGRPQNEGVRSLRNGAKGLISLRYAGDFCARDTTERLFRQFQKVNSRKLRVLLTPGQWCLGKGHDGPRTQTRFPSAPSLSLLAPCCHHYRPGTHALGQVDAKRQIT